MVGSDLLSLTLIAEYTLVIDQLADLYGRRGWSVGSVGSIGARLAGSTVGFLCQQLQPRDSQRYSLSIHDGI